MHGVRGSAVAPAEGAHSHQIAITGSSLIMWSCEAVMRLPSPEFTPWSYCAQVLASMAPAGPPPAAGDAILGLPTLVHRGPGNFERPTERMVLFFTIKVRSPRLIAEINSSHIRIFSRQSLTFESPHISCAAVVRRRPRRRRRRRHVRLGVADPRRLDPVARRIFNRRAEDDTRRIQARSRRIPSAD